MIVNSFNLVFPFFFMTPNRPNVNFVVLVYLDFVFLAKLNNHTTHYFSAISFGNFCSVLFGLEHKLVANFKDFPFKSLHACSRTLHV